MLCQGALMNAAAVTACLLAVLGLGSSLSAEDCSHCFYRRMAPQGPSSEALRLLCHSGPRGQAFATLHSPTCDTAALFAFRLGHVGTEGEGEEPVVVTENEDIQVLTPALLRGDGGETQTSAAPDDSPLQLWDSSVTTLVRSSVGPRCSAVAGDLYVVTGRGRLGPKEEGEDVWCAAGLLFWSAMCCDVSSSGGEKGFNMALVREAEGGEEKVVSVKQLEEMLGVTELFSEGCGGVSEEAAGDLVVGVLVKDALMENVEHPEDSGTDQNSDGGEIMEQEASVEAQVADVDAALKTSDKEEGMTPPQDPDEEQSAMRRSEAQLRTKSDHSSDDGETVEQTAKTEPKEAGTNSTIVYLISTTIYILTLPLRPVVSTITSLPRQVVYILQEDLGVLAALPGDTFYLAYLVTTGVLSWIRWPVDILLDLGWGCVCGLYQCTWAMLGELLGCCYTGLTGVGTLASHLLGIVGGAVDNAWWVTRLLGSRLWEQSEGYAGTVASEMGGQVMTVGGGLGKLLWRSVKGVGHMIRFTGDVILGTVRLIAVGIIDPSTTPDDTPVVVNHLINAE